MARDGYDIYFGGEALRLEKSERLVAVRPGLGLKHRAHGAIASMAAHPAIPAERLGGFDVIELAPNRQGKHADASLNLLRRDAAIATGSHVFVTPGDDVPLVPTGNLYLVFEAEVPPAERQEVLAAYGLQIREARESEALIVRVTPASPNPVKVAAALQASGKLAVCEPEFATPGQLLSFTPPSGGLLADQWHLENRGRHRGSSTGFKAKADARVTAAWKELGSLGSPQAVIAIIDDGFDLGHPDLPAPGRIVHPRCFQRGSADCSPGNADWHGTACAGVAAGRTPGSGVYGVAPGATLMPVRWGSEVSETQVESWFDYVTDRGAWVVSCSWSALRRNYPLPELAFKAIRRCATAGRGGKGCVVVFAAGNENRNINDPGVASVNGFAIHPDVIAVAASTSMDVRSPQSNFGREIALCAPSGGAGGWGLLTSDVRDGPTGSGASETRGRAAGDYLYDFNDTSAACAVVAGVAALVLSANPNLTAAEVKSVLMSTARKIPDPSRYTNGHSIEFGAGCVDAQAAIRKARQL